MGTSVFCLSSSEPQAVTIVRKIKAAGFADSDISVLFPDKSGTRDFAHEQHTKAPEGALAGVGTGGAVGAVVGLLAGIGTLAIPGLGPFVAAGPIMSTLSGAAVGAAVGGLAGGLIGMGLPELEAKRYEGKIRDGNILISVHAETPDETASAKNIFANAGASDIITGSEAMPPKVEVRAGMREPLHSTPSGIPRDPPIL